MNRIVILTGHFPNQKRRPSLLWVSDALQAMGWHVTLATVGYSWLSRLAGDKRLRSLPDKPRPGSIDFSASLTSIFGYAPIHPVGFRSETADRLLEPLQHFFTSYWLPRLQSPLSRADLVVIESGAPVMLAKVARQAAPKVPLIYRVNDDIGLLKAPPVLIDAETRHIPLFDRISTPSPHLARRFDHPNITLDPMGIPRAELTKTPLDPFRPRAGIEAVCAGTTQVDLSALQHIALSRPRWRLHVLGHLRQVPPALPNLVLHGEQSFETTLAHVAHADVGLAPYLDKPGIEYQTTNSNRLLLYRHFGLPILGPDRLCDPEVPAIIGYSDPDAWFRCETQEKRPEFLPDWSDLARSLTQN
ncbi:hypothetical protein [Primorskyibacter sp. S87]|uniref:GumK N-terminal domain-containing glycosyltransferase n=1 Tax=Primorskyibacter sp. S87 TaxID=3415126 RepID=UPI003C79756E